MTTSTKAIPITILALLLAVGAYGNDNDTNSDVDEAAATAPTVEVNFSFGRKSFGDYDYEFVDATMRGAVERDDGTTGRYEVPIKLAYPVGGGNGVAVVDFVNSIVLTGSVQAGEGNPHACVRGGLPMNCQEEEGETGRAAEQLLAEWARGTSEGYLFDKGYTLMSLQWSKAAVEAFGSEPPDGYSRHRLAYGTIEKAADRLGIAKDASRWLRDPSHYEGGATPDVEPSESDYVIGFGYSFGAQIIPHLIHDGVNEPEDGTLYEGFLLWGRGDFCAPIIGDYPYWASTPCFGLEELEFDPVQAWETGDAKVIEGQTETTAESYFGPMGRDPGIDDPEIEPNPNFRTWELAGTAHIGALRDVSAWGADGDVNVLDIDHRPVIRASFFHLTNWITDGVEPPSTAHIEGDVITEEEAEDDAELIGAPGQLGTARDEDGNALGGVRLPHLPREVDGETVGAPTGTYRGSNFAAMEKDPPVPFALMAGLFEPFSDEELAERYPTRKAYLERYKAALDEVIAEGYLLEADRERLLARAGEVDIPEAPEAADLPDAADECIGHACPGESGIDLPEGGVVRLELVHQGDWAPEIRTSAWFAGDQAPNARPFPRPPEHWHVQDGDDLCRDLREDDFFPGGDVEHRSYLDAGNKVEFVTHGTEITLPRVENGQDEATWQWHDILYRAHIPAANVVPGADYDVVLAEGEDLSGRTYEAALRLPADFQLAFPQMDGTVIMPADRDFRVLRSEGPGPHDFDYTFVSFADQYGPVGFCIGPPSGHITIPAEFLEGMPYAGSVQFGVLNHQVEKRDGRRIDFIGVNSHEATYHIDNEYLRGVNPE